MMTEQEKEEFKSVLERFGIPVITIVDLTFIAVTVYGSFAGYSRAVMIILTIFSFVGYHLTFRPLVGQIVGAFRPKLNLNSKLMLVDPVEMDIYELFHVRDWKEVVPAWNKTHFMLSIKDAKDVNKVGQVLRYNMSAEITHHINFYVSLFGTLFCLFKYMQGWWWMFGSASLIIGFLADLPFIMIQRYNRARVYPIYQRLEQRAKKEAAEAEIEK